MKRVYATRNLTHDEMKTLADLLGRCGLPTAAVGKNYIAFYECVKIRRMTDGVLHERCGSDVPDAGETD